MKTTRDDAGAEWARSVSFDLPLSDVGDPVEARRVCRRLDTPDERVVRTVSRLRNSRTLCDIFVRLLDP